LAWVLYQIRTTSLDFVEYSSFSKEENPPRRRRKGKLAITRDHKKTATVLITIAV
jgi:hypothetical protein